MRVALDTMGGDFAPHNPLSGAEIALDEILELELALVGLQEKLAPWLEEHEIDSARYQIVPAAQVVGMGDAPTTFLSKRRDTTIGVALTLHRLNNVDAVVSAGNTGAVVATSMIILGRIEGVLRPVIGSILPTRGSPCLLLDVGVNPDCRAVHLLQFGIMGAIYVQEVLKAGNPRVGLLSIGSESNKGNELTLFAYKLFNESHLNFVGNIEGSDILSGEVDVAVCDGFTGNLLLKFAESFPAYLADNLKLSGNGSSVEAAKLIRREFNPDNYGGVPILGVDGTVVVCHGGSSPRAFASAIRVAVDTRRREINRTIATQVSEINRFYAMNKYFQHLREQWDVRKERIYMKPRRFFSWFSDRDKDDKIDD